MMDLASSSELPHLPYPTTIDAYGRGGFRFAGMSHRGSILCLPDGVWAWPVARPEDVTLRTLEPVLSKAETIDFLVIGTGAASQPLAQQVLAELRSLKIPVETMRTGAAVASYNILFGEGRRVAAGLIAVA